MRKIKISNRSIGDNQPVFIIAEVGINHSGNLKQALAMIDVAVRAGVDAVKFQAFKATKMYSTKAGNLNYASKTRSILDIVEEMEMPNEWPKILSNYCNKKKTIFFSSVCDEESVDLMDPFMPMYKITSYEMTHIPLLKYVAKKNKPILLSTGTASLKEVEKSVDAILSTGNKKLILLQCTGSYPAPLHTINAKAIVTMKKKFNLPVGLSDHSADPIIAPMVATALGANVIEKHITLSRDLPGPDQKMAITPTELNVMVKKIKEVEVVLGTGIKKVHNEEKYVKKFARRSVYTINNITQGEKFSKKNIAVLRSGEIKGYIEPDDYEKIIGKTSKRNIKINQAIKKADCS
jgi:sialic acid synthase SpsE